MMKTPALALLAGIVLLTVPTGALAQAALVEPLDLDFGQVAPGSSGVLPVTVTSIEVDDLWIYAAFIAPYDNPTGFFAITAMDPIDLPLHLGDSMSLEVSYTPTSAGVHAGVMTIVTNDTHGSIKSVDLLGESPAPIPEPTILCLLGTGLAGLAVAAWRRPRRP